jgi:hypothetical protein
LRIRFIASGCLAVGLLLAGTFTALAASGLSSTRSAAVAQYGPPPPVAEDSARGHGATTETTSEEAPPLPSNVNPEVVLAPPPVVHVEPTRTHTPPRRAVQGDVQGERQAAVIAPSGLPFTGYVAIGVLFAALVLLAAGLFLRAVVSKQSPER